MIETIIDRPIYTEKLKSLMNKTDIVKIITGVRRCGKSKLLSMFQIHLQIEHKIKEHNIININLEDLLQTEEIGLNYNDKGLLIGYKKLLDFIIHKIINQNEMFYLFVDEIQLLENWQRVINTLRLRNNIDIYLTGSNAYMFSSELANSLGGRYMEIKMLPYSFKEYYSAYCSSGCRLIVVEKTREEFLNKYNLQTIYQKYITESGFPQTVSFSYNKQLINDYLNDTIYISTIQKDIIQRFNISSPNKLDILAKFLFDNIGNETSIRGIERSLKAINQNISAMTIDTYLQGLIHGHLIYKCDRYDIKGKQILTNTNSKYYSVDLGLRTSLLGYKDKDMGRVLENIVYLELLRRGYKVYTGKVNTRKNIEVDFVAEKPEGEIEYYQVSYTIAQEETLKRELKSLEEIDDNYPKFLLTMDEGRGNNKGIRRINVLEWLVE